MKAIILSAGQGSRLGHLVDDRPKCLIEFNGRTLLDRQLDTLEANGVRVDPAARRVLVDGAEITLANKEYELLRALISRAGQVVSREEILREVWNDPEMKTSKTLDMHMSWLRRKIGGERRIATVRGVGFRFNS